MARKPGTKNGPAKGEGGRPLKGIDWELAKKLAHIQCTAVEIAATLGVDDNTLVNACKRENKQTFSEWYKKHSENGKCSLRRSMWKMATDTKPNPTMAIWLSKNYLGMKDTIEQQIEMKQTPTINVVFGDESKN
jgi:hypothetical protein